MSMLSKDTTHAEKTLCENHLHYLVINRSIWERI